MMTPPYAFCDESVEIPLRCYLAFRLVSILTYDIAFAKGPRRRALSIYDKDGASVRWGPSPGEIIYWEDD